MRILGIDPGFAITGFSIIDYIGNKFKLEKSGAILTEAKVSFPLRLEKINKELSEIIESYNPDNRTYYWDYLKNPQESVKYHVSSVPIGMGELVFAIAYNNL